MNELHHQVIQQQETAAQPAKKKPYFRPELEKLGSLQTLTQMPVSTDSVPIPQ